MHQEKGRIAGFIRSKLPTGKFARGVTLLAGGNALGQILMLAASPILTRLYTPVEFGLLALYMSVTVIIQVALSMRYELAINLAKSMREAMAILKLCLLFVALFTVATCAFVVSSRDWFATTLGAPELAQYLWMLPISVLFIGSFNALNFWCVREGEFSVIGKARLKQVLASLIVQIGGASLGPAALIGGQVANQSVGMISLGKKPLRMPEFKAASITDMQQALIRYRRFPLYSTWASILNRSSLQLPTFFFVILFGPAVAGFYAIANRVLKAPSGIFIGAINNVFLKSAASAHREGNVRELTLTTFKNLTIMTLPPLLILALIAPELFTIVFGEKWSIAGEFARWMTILVFFTLITSPLTALFVVYEKQSHDLVFQIVLTLARAVALYVGALIGDSVVAVMLFSVFSGMCYAGVLVWVGKQIGSGVIPMARDIMRALAIALAMSAPIIAANLFGITNNLRILAIGLSLVLCYVHLLRLVKKIK